MAITGNPPVFRSSGRLTQGVDHVAFRGMGKLALATALVLAAVGCGGPQEQGDPGATCFRDDECAYGLVCAAVGTGERTCTGDVAGLVSTYAPEMQAAAGGAANGGTSAGGDNAGGAVGAGGTEPSAGGSEPGSGGTVSGAGAPSTAGAPGCGGGPREEPAGGAPGEPAAGASG